MDEGFSRPLKDLSATEVRGDCAKCSGINGNCECLGGAAVRGEAVAEARPLYWAAINCSHAITGDVIRLYYDPTLPGNALSQLGDRLDAAAAKLSARAADALDSQPAARPTVKQLAAQLCDGQTWTVAEQNAFAEVLACFPDESSQGIISLGDAWKHGQEFGKAQASSQPTDGGVRNG